MSEDLGYGGPIEAIFRHNLKIESNPMSIESLFTGRLRDRITYDPYYQRNYVWDKVKASYFIESILLGTEIPPLIFFNVGGKIEVIDGRQRYQTIDRFVKGNFDLAAKGLLSMKSLAKLRFDDLANAIRDTFVDTTLRVIEFSIVGADSVNEVQEDIVKKEIFRRYNSGITSLRKSEIQKAQYIEDDVTNYFRDKLQSDSTAYSNIVHIFSSERNQSRLNDPRLIDEIMMHVRKLLILQDIPIRYFESAPGREVAAIMYENMSEAADPEDTFDSFMSKVRILCRLQPTVSTSIPSNNRYLYEALYWCLAILEKEEIHPSQVCDVSLVKDLKRHVQDNSDVYDSETLVFRADTIARFERTSDFFSERFDLNLSDMYVNNNGRVSVNQYRSTEQPIDKIEDVNDIRLNKPDAQTITVENLHQRMHRRRFLVRPSYQRYESITNVKASAIIESMLLGIKLPPIFVFERNDGVMEVIDGQQRILSILGFMGLEFIDENNNKASSNKHDFKLRKLRILTELNGKSFSDLDMQLQDKLWDFTLYQVTIREKVNENFDPVDLFIRLNNKPYPIKDNTFEMWNSFVERDIVQLLKDKTAKYEKWFYLRRDNRRMDNETLFTTLAYFEYSEKAKGIDNALGFYPQGGTILSRVTSKVNITRVLECASQDATRKTKFTAAIKSVESFVRKVRTLLIDRNIPEDQDKWLDNELTELLGTNRRTYNQFYVLWYVLRKITLSMIQSRRDVIKQRIYQLMMFVRDSGDIEEQFGVQFFQELVKSIWEDHSPAERKLSLSKVEISKYIVAQNNRCPICGDSLYIGDDVEVDHIFPISIGGPDNIENTQIVHWICNREKGKTVEQI